MGRAAIIFCLPWQDGVGEHDGCLGCRPAHPDTGPGGQYGGDVSHQSAPQRAEVWVCALCFCGLIVCRAGSREMICQAEHCTTQSTQPCHQKNWERQGRTTRPLLILSDLFSALFIDDAICNNIYLSLRPFMLTSVNTCCFYSSRINLANKYYACVVCGPIDDHIYPATRLDFSIRYTALPTSGGTLRVLSNLRTKYCSSDRRTRCCEIHCSVPRMY